MFVDLIRTSGLMTLPVASMLFFMLVFALVLARMLGRRKGSYDGMASMPLREDDGS